MFFLEQAEYTEDEARIFVEAMNVNDDLRIQIIDPIIQILNKPSARKEYIAYGTEFLQANAEMLAKEFPTKAVSFPRKYVDNVFALFGFSQKQFKEILKAILKTVNDKTAFDTVTPAWHDKPYIYKTDIVSDEKIKIEIEWQPPKS